MLSALFVLFGAIVFGAPAMPAPTPSPVPPRSPAPAGSGWSAQQIARLHAGIDRALAAATLRGAQIGLLAVDTVRGTMLYSHNADQEFMPASNFKLLVGSAALQRLGTGFS